MKNVVVVALLALTGCPGPEGEGGSKLIGTWDELPSITQDEDEELGVVTFRDDGTYEIDDDTELDTGTFVEDGDVLILTREDGSTEEMPYASDGQLFTPIGLRHVGGGTELEGEWRAEGINAGNPQAVVLQLASDSTFALDIDDGHLTGTWRVDAGELITTLQFPSPDDGSIVPIDMQWHSIDDTISFLAYDRR